MDVSIIFYWYLEINTKIFDWRKRWGIESRIKKFSNMVDPIFWCCLWDWITFVRADARTSTTSSSRSYSDSTICNIIAYFSRNCHEKKRPDSLDHFYGIRVCRTCRMIEKYSSILSPWSCISRRIDIDGYLYFRLRWNCEICRSDKTYPCRKIKWISYNIWSFSTFWSSDETVCGTLFCTQIYNIRYISIIVKCDRFLYRYSWGNREFMANW